MITGLAVEFPIDMLFAGVASTRVRSTKPFGATREMVHGARHRGRATDQLPISLHSAVSFESRVKFSGHLFCFEILFSLEINAALSTSEEYELVYLNHSDKSARYTVLVYTVNFYNAHLNCTFEPYPLLQSPTHTVSPLELEFGKMPKAAPSTIGTGGGAQTTGSQTGCESVSLGPSQTPSLVHSLN